MVRGTGFGPYRLAWKSPSVFTNRLTPMNHSNKDGASVGGERGGKAAAQGTFPFDTYPTPSGIARVRWPPICEKNRMR